jgi:hypothetical protein
MFPLLSKASAACRGLASLAFLLVFVTGATAFAEVASRAAPDAAGTTAAGADLRPSLG